MIFELNPKGVCITVLTENKPMLLWSEGIHIIFALAGTVHVLLGGEEKTLQTAGLLLLNPTELCRLSCAQNSRAITLHIPKDCLDLVGWQGHIHCFADSSQASPQTVFDQLRRELAKTVLLLLNQKPKQELYGALFTLMRCIEQHFPMQTVQPNNQVSQSSITRLNQVLQWIHMHQCESVSVAQIAEQVHITPNYLSRFFHRHLHITITEYLLTLRMQQARTNLAGGAHSVTEIAMQTGFRSAPAFIAKFRQLYGTTPKQYQRSLRVSSSPNVEYSFINADDSKDLSVLLHYLPPLEPIETEKDSICRRVELSVNCETRPLRHTWRRLLNFGYAREGLLAPVQQQICRAQREIGFEYVRFHGIFDDEMQFYQEDKDGHPLLNFLYIDLLLDFLVSQGFKLYIELGLMPKALKKYDVFVLKRQSNYSVAANPDLWGEIVRQSVQHWIARYGLETVLTWRFTTMGLHVPVFTCVTFAEFYQHYQISYQAVKAVDSTLQFGGPGGFAGILWDGSCLADFFHFARENNCFPDFITVQNYPHQNMSSDPEFMNTSASQTFLPAALSGDRQFTRRLLERIRSVLAQSGQQPRPIWMEEWNSTIWQRDLSGDTCYKSAWLAKEIAENYDDAEAFGYWLLTDFVEERGAFSRIFHGGYGLFTYNGVPKSGWQTLCLLRRLGGALLARGESYLVTRTTRQLQIVLFHYCRYDNLYRHRYRQLERPNEAYHVFEKSGRLKVELKLYDLPCTPHRLQRFCIGQKQGSSFDEWLRWGAPENLNADDFSLLCAAGTPAYATELLTPDEKGCYILQSELEPHEVQLLLIDL